MRVALLSHNYPPHSGGLEVMVQNLARGLARAHQVVVVSSGWDRFRGESVEAGVTVHRIPALHVTERFGVPYPVPLGPGLRPALQAIASADVLHAHGALYANSVLAAWTSARARKPLVLTEHVGFVTYRREMINAVQRAAWSAIGDRVVRASQMVTAYNSRVQEWLQQRFPGLRVRYVGNGVDTSLFRPRSTAERKDLRRELGLPADEVLALFVARASEKKNLDAVLEIPREGYHLVVCGAQRGLRSRNLTDFGLVPYARMPELFGCVDLMVHASAGEGLPLAVQEGIASGLPIALLWDDGYAGWISPEAVSPCRSLAELGPAVRRLATSADARKSLSARARAWAEQKWSWNETVAQYESLYAEALSGKSGTWLKVG
jgi:D-inositol-3-phosphate glycosyltransferase